MKIFVTGYDGRLGSELVRLGAEPLECDITIADSISEALAKHEPDVIINCAAYTDVDGAEDNYEQALKVNTWGVGKLRDLFWGRLIHLSTDYVFKGFDGPYDEKNIQFDPVNSYGFSKMGGETLLTTADNQNSVIVRTTGLYGGCSGKHDFVKMVISNLREQKPLQVTKSLKGNQTYIPHLAEALMMCAVANKIPNVLHIASRDVISRYDFAIMIANVFGYDSSCLIPVDSKQITGWKAHRPRKGGLKVKRAEKNGLPIYSILEGLKAYKDAQC